MTTQKHSDDKIAEAAFYIWLEEGQPHGRDQDHWHRAVEQLKAAAPAPKKRRAAAKPKAEAAAKPRKRAAAKPKAKAKD